MNEPAQPVNLLRTQSMPPVAPPSTINYEGPLVVRRPGQASTDIQILLHKRLWFLSILLTAGMIIQLTVSLGAILIVGGIGELEAWGYSGFVPYCSLLALSASLTAILWRRSLSMRQLRAMELVEFGALFAFFSWTHAWAYPTMRLESPPFWFGIIMATAVSLPWVFTMIVYGILIPNPWRRCALVVGIMALAPLIISKTSGLAASATAGHVEGTFYIVVGHWCALGAAIAIYGSQHFT